MLLDPDLAEIVDGWADGWTRTRGTAPAERRPYGWEIATAGALTGETRRHLVTRSLEDVSDLLVADASPGVALKFPGRVEKWRRAELPARWSVGEAGWFFTRELRPRAVDVPAGLRLVVTDNGEFVRAEVHAGEQVAASGQIGLGEEWAVPDRIVTEAAYRRRALGRVIMTTLETAASERGLRRGVLGATTDGRALYAALGWREAGSLTWLQRH